MGEITAVFDTNVVISAYGWGGTPEECVELVLTGDVSLVGSQAMLDELHRVLNYPKFDFSADDKSKILFLYADHADFVTPETDLDVVVDADDNKFVECAVAADVDYVVSGDSHLLDLGSYDGIEVVDPATFLDIVDGQCSE